MDKDNRKLVCFRLDEDTRTEFQIFLLKNKTTQQEVLENYVKSLLQGKMTLPNSNKKNNV